MNKMTLEEFIKFLNKDTTNLLSNNGKKLTSKDQYVPLGVYCMEGEYASADITVEEAYNDFYKAFTKSNGCTTIDDFIASGYEFYDLCY